MNSIFSMLSCIKRPMCSDYSMVLKCSVMFWHRNHANGKNFPTQIKRNIQLMNLKCWYLGSGSIYYTVIKPRPIFSCNPDILIQVVNANIFEINSLLTQLMGMLLDKKQLIYILLLIAFFFLKTCFLTSVFSFSSCASWSQHNCNMWLPGYMCKTLSNESAV